MIFSTDKKKIDQKNILHNVFLFHILNIAFISGLQVHYRILLEFVFFLFYKLL